MNQNKKARTAPGKDDAIEILTACAACGAPIRAGEKTGSVLIPIGFDFSGRIIGERLPVCEKCIRIADKGADKAALVEKAIRIRYEAESEAVHKAKGEFH